MGYPKDFQIPVSDTQAYKQFGNSVVVPVVARIAKAVVATLQRPTDFRPELVLAANDKANAEAAKRTAVPVSYRKAMKKRKA
jgi:DNA (cytosine-5)-methyltransferase 1